MQTRLQLLASIAELYYKENRSQAEIARKTGYSRSAISRLLTEARDAGVVEIKIHHPVDRAYELEDALMQAFPLQNALVTNRGNKPYEVSLQDLGRVGAAYVNGQLPSEGVVALSWGTGVKELVDALPDRKLPKVKIAQLIGGAGSNNPFVDEHEVARNFAGRIGANYWTVNAPLIVKDAQTKQLLLAEESILETIALAEQSHLAIVGIGTTNLERSNLVRSKYLSLEEARMLQQSQAVGDICAHYFDINGSIMDIDINRRVIGVHPSTFAKRDCMVVGVAAGIKKAKAIYGAMMGNLIDVLVTDSRAAEAVLKLHRSMNLSSYESFSYGTQLRH